MAGHDGHLRARQQALDLPQQLDAGLRGELKVRQHQVWYFCIEARESSLGAFRFGASEAQGIADGHAQPADALLVIHHQ